MEWHFLGNHNCLFSLKRNLLHSQMCISKKYPYSPHITDWNFLEGGGSLRPKHFKKCIKLNWNFQRGGGGGLEKNPFCGGGGGVWIFPGNTQCTDQSNTIKSHE